MGASNTLPPVSRFINLASAALGAKAISATDEFFGAKERLLNDDAPVFIPGKYDGNGKWMDGWESRRRRGEGHDSCVVQLAAPGVIHCVDIDTTHFTGNYPHAASIDAALTTDDPADADWVEILPPRALDGNSQNTVELGDKRTWSHLKLHIYPDGGVARLRVQGMPTRIPAADANGLLDLACALSGTRAVAWNDAHFGRAQNLTLPGVGLRMEDGWETRRRREPGNDWSIFALGHPGTIERVEIDTSQFKGNYPDQASLQAAYLPGMDDAAVIPLSLYWSVLMPPQKLQADQVHRFTKQIAALGAVTHVRFNIIPDGGVNRLRLLGRLQD